ncbi:MAG: hypothetical protein FWC51_02025, partial [Proteobacteria bacterium]|nr:hypothetical protein [Pseudomonadota bacterium]
LFLPIFLFATTGAFANQKRHDDYRDIDVNCDKDWSFNSRIFCNFPQVRVCQQHTWSDSWSSCFDAWCPNFSKEICSGTGMVQMAMNIEYKSTTSCWACKCDAGLVMYLKQCITTAACKSMAGFDVSSDGTQCVTSNWCNDTYKNAYAANPALYTQGCSVEMTEKTILGLIPIKVCTGCVTLKCANGCMDSTTGMTCKAVDPNGTVGGTTTDPTTSLCKKCDATSYVDADNTTTGCSPATKATRTQMCNCFGCVGKTTKDSAGKDIDAFANCVKTGITTGCDQASAANVVCQ